MNPQPAVVVAPLRRALGYVAALILPSLFTLFSFRTHALHSTPLALSMAAIAVVTIFSGLGPGLLSAFWMTLFFNHEVAGAGHFAALGPRELGQTLAVLTVALLIVLFFHRQHIIDNKLRVALASLQAQTDALVEAQQASSSVAWTLDTDTGRIRWAEGGAEIFGRPFTDASMMEPSIGLVLEEDRPAVESGYQRAFAASRPFQIQFRTCLPNGELRWLESRGTPSPSNSRIWRGVTMDITDRKNSELALIRSEKLAAIGRLSATIAHEINNPLEAITNLLYLSSGDGSLSSPTRAYLANADQELRRLASIARHTLSFARSRSIGGPVDSAPILESVVTMFQPRCSSQGGRIHLLHNPSHSILVPSDDLRQILTNLVSNACDALNGHGGLVEIDVVPDVHQFAIEVRDNGVGISPDVLPRIFDPFFTTKEDVGTGIGLWVTCELVEKNGGRIAVHTSDLPAGFSTVFRVEFPLSS